MGGFRKAQAGADPGVQPTLTANLGAYAVPREGDKGVNDAQHLPPASSPSGLEYEKNGFLQL